MFLHPKGEEVYQQVGTYHTIDVAFFLFSHFQKGKILPSSTSIQIISPVAAHHLAVAYHTMRPQIPTAPASATVCGSAAGTSRDQ